MKKWLWLPLILALIVPLFATQKLAAQTRVPPGALPTIAPPGAAKGDFGAAPNCTTAQKTTWQAAWDFGQGVIARDPVGEKIGPAIAYRDWVGLNWYPASIYKQTLCGRLHHFNFYDGAGDEADWNLFIIPAAPFAYLRDDIKLIADPDDLHKCNTAGDCMEGEVTPDEHFYNNPYFDKPSDDSSQAGKDLCAYGPWVWEEAHGNRPEIHPSELIWWRERVKFGPYKLFLMQDDSNRFDRADDFNVSSPAPAWWHPWSQNPRTGEFRIAFKVKPGDPTLVYDIFEEYARNVVTGSDATARADAGGGRQHTMSFDGRPPTTAATVAVQVNERQANDDNLGVRFTGICRNPGDRSLQGYVTITSKIGVNDRGGEGYHVLRVVGSERGSPPAAIARLAPPAPSVRAHALGRSLRLQTVNGKPALVGDVELSVLEQEGVTRDKLAIARVEAVIGSKRQALAVGAATAGASEAGGEAAAVAARGQVGGLPALNGGALVVTLGSGQTVRLTLPRLALAPQVGRGESQGAAATALALANVAAKAGLNLPAAGGLLQQVESARLLARPRYAPEKDGKFSPEDDSPFTEELNEALEDASPADRSRLFGTEQPFSIQWSFIASEVASGRPVPVRVNQDAGPGEIRVDTGDGKFTGEVATVRFPGGTADAVYKVSATATVADPFGLTQTIQREVWSHELAGDPTAVEKALLPDLAGKAGMQAADFAALSDLVLGDGAAPAALPARTRRAQLARLYLARAASDGRVDLGELEALARLAGRIGK